VRGLGCDGFVRIDEVAELLAGFEVGNTLGWDRDRSAGFGVTAGAGLALAGAETSETADFDLVVGLKGGDDRVKEGIDDDLAIAAGEVSQGGNVIDEFGFRHIFRGSGVRECRATNQPVRPCFPAVSVYVISRHFLP